jgi:hypothetical protein
MRTVLGSPAEQEVYSFRNFGWAWKLQAWYGDPNSYSVLNC